MAFDYSKLIGRIAERFRTQSNFSKEIGLSERSISLKMNGIVGWKQWEIVKACQLLGIAESEIPEYFFTLKVQNIEP